MTKLTNGIRDIFVGKGWKGWSRYRKAGKYYLHIAGNKLAIALVEKCFNDE